MQNSDADNQGGKLLEKLNNRSEHFGILSSHISQVIVQNLQTTNQFTTILNI